MFTNTVIEDSWSVLQPDDLVSRLKSLESPTKGFELEDAFRLSRIDLRFRMAKIKNIENQKIILIDL